MFLITANNGSSITLDQYQPLLSRSNGVLKAPLILRFLWHQTLLNNECSFIRQLKWASICCTRQMFSCTHYFDVVRRVSFNSKITQVMYLGIILFSFVRSENLLAASLAQWVGLSYQFCSVIEAGKRHPKFLPPFRQYFACEIIFFYIVVSCNDII